MPKPGSARRARERKTALPRQRGRECRNSCDNVCTSCINLPHEEAAAAAAMRSVPHSKKTSLSHATLRCTWRKRGRLASRVRTARLQFWESGVPSAVHRRRQLLHLLPARRCQPVLEERNTEQTAAARTVRDARACHPHTASPGAHSPREHHAHVKQLFCDLHLEGAQPTDLLLDKLRASEPQKAPRRLLRARSCAVRLTVLQLSSGTTEASCWRTAFR
jgi:hypothetical protein